MNDMLFQSTGGAQSNQGYYANVGRTRRQGIEASLARSDARRPKLQWHLNYTHLDATFRSGLSSRTASTTRMPIRRPG
ncbi:MAG: hypothetical protein U1F35_10600 [Steroidobacteraceae bacterium]